MSIKYMNWVWENTTIKGLTRFVLLALADNANDEGVCWPSYQTIADKVNADRKRVMKSIKELEQLGYLSINHRYAGQESQSNIYHLKQVGAPAPLTGGVETTTPGGARTTTQGRPHPQVGVPAPLKPPINHPLTRTEEPSEESSSAPFSIPIIKMLNDASGLAAFPADQQEWMENVRCLGERYGVQKATEAMKEAFKSWCKRRTKDNRQYRPTNLAWIKDAEEILLVGNGRETTREDWNRMTPEEKNEYIATGKAIPK